VLNSINRTVTATIECASFVELLTISRDALRSVLEENRKDPLLLLRESAEQRNRMTKETRVAYDEYNTASPSPLASKRRSRNSISGAGILDRATAGDAAMNRRFSSTNGGDSFIRRMSCCSGMRRHKSRTWPDADSVLSSVGRQGRRCSVAPGRRRSVAPANKYSAPTPSVPEDGPAGDTTASSGPDGDEAANGGPDEKKAADSGSRSDGDTTADGGPDDGKGADGGSRSDGDKAADGGSDDKKAVDGAPDADKAVMNAADGSPGDNKAVEGGPSVVTTDVTTVSSFESSSSLTPAAAPTVTVPEW